ncbi:MAG: AAA family ATPase, partial [Polyangiales bacterium]
MLQKDVDVVQALAAHAVDERALLTVLSSLAPERGATLERSLERAARLAERLGQKRVEALHLLVAFTRDRRCNAFAALTTLGVHAVRLGDALLDAYFQSQAVHARSRQAQAVTTTAHKRRPRAPALASAAHKSLKAAASPTLDSERSARAWAMPSRHASPPAAPMGGQARPSQPEAAPQLRADPAMPEPPPRKARLRPPRNRRAAPIEPSASVPCTAVAAPASEAGSTATNDPSTQPSVALDGRRFPLLTSLGRNLSALAATGAIDPVVGREAESEQLLDILARRRANNPVLVGPPGVGKTAVVEGLAHSLAQGGAGVRGLEQTLLIELSVGALLAGTGVRGAVGERLRRLRQELATAPGRVVLFIDEIHTLLAAGESPDDLAQELKAGLARGEFPCIGATTEDEYRRYFERDPALMRRFSPVRITEPDADSATAIVRGILPRYEDYHQVRYAPAALEAAVHLSQRYLVDRHLPDKAIALIDTIQTPDTKAMTIRGIGMEAAQLNLPDDQLKQLFKT